MSTNNNNTKPARGKELARTNKFGFAVPLQDPVRKESKASGKINLTQ